MIAAIHLRKVNTVYEAWIPVALPVSGNDIVSNMIQYGVSTLNPAGHRPFPLRAARPSQRTSQRPGCGTVLEAIFFLGGTFVLWF